jgi:hypothetical protein
MKEKLTAHAPTPKFVQIWGVLFILFSTFIVAQTASHPSGMLYASGAVTVNHNPVNRSVSVFAGDIVTTGANATATIISNGSQLVVPAHSTISYGNTSSGNTGMSANSGNNNDDKDEHKCKGDECKKCKGDDKEHCMCKVSEDDDHEHGHGHGDGQSKNMAMATNGNNGDGGNGDDDMECEHEN